MDRAVRERRIFYIPGFDPLSARRYRELYRTEAAKQAAISGDDIAVRGCPGAVPYAWEVTGRIEGGETRARVEFLAWNDIVAATLRRPILVIYLLMLRTFALYLFRGAMIPLLRLRPGPMVAGLAPVGFMALYLAAAGLAGWGASWAAGSAGLPGWAGAGLGLLAFLGVMQATRALEPLIFTYYLICDYAFVSQREGATPPELERRVAGFADRIAAALAPSVDEVLVVGHSSGAHLAVQAVAEVLRRGLPEGAPPFALLTLGQAIPMVSFLPGATGLRRDLHALAGDQRLFWLDVSAMGDGASFALCDPVAVTGVAPERQRWPLVISAAFSQTLSPERLSHLRWRYFLRHIQYLCAFDRPGDYDYFRITAGPRTLAARFRDRRPSPSREGRVFSRHRGMA